MTTLPTLHPFPDVARKLGISLRGLRERARARRFTHVRIGAERYFTDDQLAEFLAASTVTTKRDDDLAATRERVERQHARRSGRARSAA